VAAIQGSGEEPLAEEEGADADAVGAAAAAAAALARTIGDATPRRLQTRALDGGTADRETIPVKEFLWDW